MNSDDFEKEVQRRPLRGVPEEWRESILRTALAGSAPGSPAYGQFLDWCRTLLWPYPKAWAGLAAVWVLIIGMHLVARSDSPSPIQFAAQPPSAQWQAAFAEQQALYTELLPRPEVSRIPRPPPAAERPRSERPGRLDLLRSQLLATPADPPVV